MCKANNSACFVVHLNVIYKILIWIKIHYSINIILKATCFKHINISLYLPMSIRSVIATPSAPIPHSARKAIDVLERPNLYQNKAANVLNCSLNTTMTYFTIICMLQILYCKLQTYDT